MRIAVVAATPMEIGKVWSALVNDQADSVLGRPCRIGQLGGGVVSAAVTGVGKVNAALTTASLLQKGPIDLVLNVGVGGAYPDCGLLPGELAVADVEVYADEGIDAGDHVSEFSAMGIPLCEVNGQRYFNRFPIHSGYSEILMEQAVGCARVLSGPFLTLSSVTSTASKCEALQNRYHALCENMEGAAVAHTCALFETPFVELRGISNWVGPRDRASWQLSQAAEEAQRAAVAFLRAIGMNMDAAAYRNDGAGG